MSYYTVCPCCGSHLDPCESCDCQCKENAAPGATNTKDGKVEQIATAVSTSILTECNR